MIEIMFWKRFKSLCASIGMSPNEDAKKLGLSSATVTYWSRGIAPSLESLEKIARFFVISIDFLVGKEDSPPSEYAADVSLEAKSLIDDVELLHKSPDLCVLLSVSSKLTRDDIAAITEIAMRINRDRDCR